MNRPKVTILWKYMSVKRALQVISTGMIRLPRPTKFNDPFDCRIRFDHEVTKREYKAATFQYYRRKKWSQSRIKELLKPYFKADGSFTQKTRRIIAAAAKQFEVDNSRQGVLSLTEDPLSILMWAHYGQKHKGVCVGFERKEDNRLGDVDTTHPVRYSKQYPSAKFAEILVPTGELSMKILFTKSNEWAYEKEWRITGPRGNTDRRIPGAVIQVLLGLKTSPRNVAEFVAVCGARGIRLRKCSMTPGKFMLEASDYP